ncbi:MAG: Glycerophosphoryl diester phosphodiesterase family-domain-containing protein [Podila humilis]|nr:MAG: Glycerophosphoryl diester phosphodiesterase family-domain-containing protein [Podila humilis]
MKFGKTLQRNQIPEWARHYVSYKGLKKDIKTGLESKASGESTMDDIITAFIFHLDREVEKVNGFFVYKRSELERRLRILSEKRPSTSVPPSPFMSDPEVDAECLQALLDTKTLLSKLSWFAEMNRRAVEKILKKFDKRMITISRADYMNTKVNLLPFVTDGALMDMTATTDALIRELRAMVADHPPKSDMVQQQSDTKANLGFSDEQLSVALKAIEQDDDTTLKAIVDAKLKDYPEIRSMPRSLFRKACEEHAFKCIALIMSFSTGALIVNVNDQTVLHRLAIEGGNFHTKSNKSGSSVDKNADVHTKTDDPTLIAFILQQLSSLTLKDSLCTLTSTSDIFGRRPLHYAAMHGYANITRALLSDLKASGEFIDFSSPYWLDTDGITPLIYAVSPCNHPSIPKIMPTTPMTVLNPLVGSDVNLHAAYTHTPLSIACRLGHVEAAKLLIQYGANLDAQDEDGESCLIIAAKNGHVNCVRLLLEGPQRRANLELRERYYGWTALHLAAIENHPEVVRILLEAGASPNVYDYSTWNPHEHAVFAANNACAALLRPVSYTLDERQKMQMENGDSHQGSPAKATLTIVQPTVDRLAGSSSPQFHRPDSPPTSGGRNHVKASKAVHRAYGHKYLEDESLILVTLGSNDIRSTVEPIELFHTESSNLLLTASTAFSLEITSENATAGERVIIDLPLKDSSYHDQIVFYASNPEETILNFSVFPTFGNTTGKIVGRGTAMLSSLDNLRKDYKHQHPTMTSLQGMNMTVPIFETDSMTIIGRVRVEFSVVRPFKHENLKVGSKHTYWKSLTTTVIGHRGLGMNRRVSNLQVGENTLLSFVTAASLGAEYVEFDVQMTKDMVPVLYHDWTVTETGLDIPVSSLTVDQFRKLSGSKSRPQTGSTPSSPNSVSSKDGNQPRLGRSNSLGAMAKLKSLNSSEPADPAAKMKGNGLGTIQAPFATLKDTFETVPTNIGFNIEVKYPMLDEAEDANIPLYSFELNRFVDRILKEVYDHDQTHPDRNIIFSSFHPDICLLLNLKQPNYPVFFLTDGGTSVMADRRCNSIQGAVRFATSIDLLGIVTASPPIIEAPSLVKGIKEAGLLVFTYGADNNDVANAKLQRRHGVDAVIVDCVLAVRKGLQQAD